MWLQCERSEDELNRLHFKVLRRRPGSLPIDMERLRRVQIRDHEFLQKKGKPAVHGVPAQERPHMNAQARSNAVSCVLDKRLLQQSVAALQSRLGLSHDPTATGEQAQEMSLRD